MRCFSLIANPFVTAVNAGYRSYVYHVPEAYPKPTAGITLDPTDRALRVGFVEKVLASDDLLRLSPDTGAIARNGKEVTLLRASVKVEGGRTLLVPEEPGDDQDALVFIDIGSGRHTFVRYTCDEKTQLVSHSRSDNEPYRQRIVVRLKPFADPVIAARSDQKWIFWGPERIKETLAIRFDGENVYYDINRPVGN